MISVKDDELQKYLNTLECGNKTWKQKQALLKNKEMEQKEEAVPWAKIWLQSLILQFLFSGLHNQASVCVYVCVRDREQKMFMRCSVGLGVF